MLYSAFQIDELHRHNQSLVGKLHATSLLWSADMKTAVSYQPSLLHDRFFTLVTSSENQNSNGANYYLRFDQIYQNSPKTYCELWS